MRKEFVTKVICILLLSCITLTCFSCAANTRPVQTSRDVEKPLQTPTRNEGFNFAIFSDRTGGNQEEGTRVWRQAIAQVNQMGPDFVYTVGYLVWGYGDRKEWLQQAEDFQVDTQLLKVPLYPVAGNHDIYWMRDTEGRPADHHDTDYETYFGPLWYAFEYENCWFITLFSDEGDLTGEAKGYKDPKLQKMSTEQFAWLQTTLKKAGNADHVFVFLHHPRWKGGGYGDDWNRVHQLFVDAGNVSACFAGHLHQADYQQKGGIDYYTLGTTGGVMSKNSLIGQHLFYWVNVAGDAYHIIGIPMNHTIDPKAIQETSLSK